MSKAESSIVKLIKLPDLFSILNALLGFSAILLVLGDTTVTEKSLKDALILILLAVVADGLDGIVARNVESSPMGKYLDSLADMLSFGIAPAIILYILIKKYLAVPDMYINIALVFCGVYVISGMLRLARFNAKESNFGADLPLKEGVLVKRPLHFLEGEEGHFEGFPITGSATFLASFMLLLIELQLPPYPSASFLIALTGMLCILMTSRIRYRNIRDRRIVIPAGMIFFTLLLFYILSLPFIYPAAIILASTAFYICSPFVLHAFGLR
ncbi:MAG: CDP-alcohol phosphatidyltransferase family protein [Candidatus Methanospirareceae archaeon]